MMNIRILLPVLLGLALTTGCTRPAQVRSLAGAAHPISVAVKRSADALQGRFAEQRSAREERATELSLQAARARNLSAGIEREWRFADQKDLGRKLTILREQDEAIRADPLAPVVAPVAVISKPPELDQAPINIVIKNLDQLKREKGPDLIELATFFQSVNSELAKLEKEQEAEPGQPAQPE